MPRTAPLTRRAILRLGGGALSLAATLLAACGGATPATAPHPFKDIEQGRTPDGFFFLGAANAPVALLDYSDFL